MNEFNYRKKVYNCIIRNPKFICFAHDNKKQLFKLQRILIKNVKHLDYLVLKDGDLSNRCRHFILFNEYLEV